jgi:CheY-like chemotaxis protein
MLDNVILVIDDDTWMQRVMGKILDKMEIRSVFAAANAFDGLDLALEEKPDVIFLDLLMPEIDGYTTLKLLKRIRKTKDIPVIIITANSDFESLGTVLAAGASEFVAKPFTYTTVMAKLEKVLSKVNEKKQQSEDFSGSSSHFNYDDLNDDEVDFFKKFDLNSNNSEEGRSAKHPKADAAHKAYTNHPDALKRML